eukprot:scaffold255408_cov36-Tisochrysis_lutea.AAC.4
MARGSIDLPSCHMPFPPMGPYLFAHLLAYVHFLQGMQSGVVEQCERGCVNARLFAKPSRSLAVP